MSGKIWFDVSLIKSWSGHLAGVMRCEAQIAAALLKEHADQVIFCYWDQENVLSEWPIEQVQEQLERMAILFVPKPEIIEPEPLTPREQFQLELAQWRQKVRRQVMRILQFWVGQGILDLARKWCAPAQIPEPEPEPIPETPLMISAQDIYVSVGAGWVIDRFNFLYHLRRTLGFKAVLLCHDVIPVRFPDLTLEWIARIFPYYLANLAWCADVVLCNSKTTQRDLHHFLQDSGAPIPPLQIVDFGNQIQVQSSEPISERVADLLGKKFILYVSTIELRKNHEMLCRAYLDLVAQGHSDLPLMVFVGSWGWGTQGLRESIAQDPRLSSLVVDLQGVLDAELAALYRACLLTVYPSHYEGWGLPVAESLSFGKFCLASCAPSLKEVGGSLVEYLPARDVSLWAQQILWYVHHPQELAQREQKIAQEFVPHSWSQTANQLINLCQAQLQ